jgi:hypothetical protein
MEKQTGIDFFLRLPIEVENSLEVKYDKSYWK